MAKITLKSPKNGWYIFSNGKDVFISGSSLWLFRADGTFVKKYDTIRRASKAIFLPDNKAFVEGGSDRTFHYISLEDGEVLWSCPKVGRLGYSKARFAVSADGSTIYNARAADSFKLCIDRMDLQTQTYERYILDEGLRVTHDIFIDENGVLCAMQSHLIIRDEEDYSPVNMSQNGILAIPIDSDGAHPIWKRQWICKSERGRSFRGCDGKYILREDYTVLDLDTMEEFRLLPEEEVATLPDQGFAWKYDPATGLLTVCYLSVFLNVIIDCKKRKVVSRYSRDTLSVGFEGCLINNEFWTCTEKGVVKRPFPNWD